VTEDAIGTVNGAWTTPTEAATLAAEADRILTF